MGACEHLACDDFDPPSFARHDLADDRMGRGPTLRELMHQHVGTGARPGDQQTAGGLRVGQDETVDVIDARAPRAERCDAEQILVRAAGDQAGGARMGGAGPRT